MILVKELRDIVGLKTKLEVVSPVPTLRGPKQLDDDDEVEINLVFGSGIMVSAVVSVATYRLILAESKKREVACG